MMKDLYEASLALKLYVLHAHADSSLFVMAFVREIAKDTPAM